MSPRTAKVVSRTLLGLAFAMMTTSVIVAFSTIPEQRPGEIVIVPEDRANEIRRDAALLDPERDCAGDPRTDPALGDAPFVLCELLADRQTGATYEGGWGDLIVGVLVAIVWIGTGTLIAARQSGNASGWIFIAIGFFFVLEMLARVLVIRGLKVDPGSVPLMGLWALVADYAFVPFGLISLLFLLYPNGKPPTSRWAWAERALFAGLAIAVVSLALTPGPLNNLVETGILYLNPIGVPALAGSGGALIAAGTITLLVASLSTIVAVRGRFKRSVGEERQQMRWLVSVATLAGSIFAFGFVMSFVLGALVERPENLRLLGFDPFDILFMLFALTLVVGIPAAYLIAIFKHGLWELDVVIKKALVAFVLTLVFVAVGGLAIAVLGQWAFWTDTSKPIAILVGALAGVLLWPLVRLSRRVARRIVFGRRADPYAVLAEFSERVGETYATEDVLPRMARILDEATGAERARVWLRVGGTLRPEAAWPAETTPAEPVELHGDMLPAIDGESAFEVRDRGELLGALSVAMPPSDPMNPAKERLIRDLASQAGLVLRNVRLIEELRASRQRLVAAQDAERRKLERNIHDGAQQQLVALQVKLRLAEQIADRDTAKAKEMLSQLQAETQTALEDLRDLARGIYPPLLADRGLAVALEAQARKVPIPVMVEPDGIGRYPEEVEAAVYFCTLEALNNVAKYAQATHVDVRLAQQGDQLVFEVRDDGVGFDPDAAGHGTGLQGMADRLDAIGGELEVEAATGSGTTIRGRVRTRSTT